MQNILVNFGGRNPRLLYKAMEKRISRETFLMCRPLYYGVEYSINPWMSLENKPDQEIACQQWDELYHKIIELGGIVELVSPVKGLPDMVFTANAGLVLDRGHPFCNGKKKVILSRFRYKERRGEEKYFRNFFEEKDYDLYKPKHYFEGAGDALFRMGRELACGFGFRSDQEIYQEFATKSLTYCALIDPNFYHLDTCYCPLNRYDCIIYPGAFDTYGKPDTSMKHVIAVSEKEAKFFACNAVKIKDHVILPKNCPYTRRTLEQIGYITHEIDMSEFIKSGGACKCLTLRI